MSLFIEEYSGSRALGIWKIDETEETLHAEVDSFDQIPQAIKHPVKRLEFFAGRALVNCLMKKMGQPFTGITKNAYGKPFMKASRYELSLSHSYPYVAALIDTDRPVGIDLEQAKPKLLRLAHRIFSIDEQASAGSDLNKHCILWCAKEAMLKYHGKKSLVFAENLLIEPFDLKEEGNLIGHIIAGSTKTTLSLHYRLNKEFVLVQTT